ncbi:MAG: hypothetical protein VW907_01065, partial [Opitutae bacterium]
FLKLLIERLSLLIPFKRLIIFFLLNFWSINQIIFLLPPEIKRISALLGRVLVAVKKVPVLVHH